MGSGYRKLKVTADAVNSGEVQLFSPTGYKATLSTPTDLAADKSLDIPLKTITVDTDSVTFAGNLADYVIKVTQATNNQGMIYLDKTQVGTGNPISIANAGTGASIAIAGTGSNYGVSVTQSGGGIGIIVTQQAAVAGIYIVEQADAEALSLNKTGSGVGNVIEISNAGTGKDIDGNSSNWYILNNGAIKPRSVAGDTARSGLSMGSGDKGAMIWNETDNFPNFWDGTQWRDAAGTIT